MKEVFLLDLLDQLCDESRSKHLSSYEKNYEIATGFEEVIKGLNTNNEKIRGILATALIGIGTQVGVDNSTMMQIVKNRTRKRA